MIQRTLIVGAAAVCGVAALVHWTTHLPRGAGRELSRPGITRRTPPPARCALDGVSSEGPAGPAGTVVVDRCFALRLNPDRVVDNSDIESARVRLDDIEGRAGVSIQLSAAGAARFEALAEACTRKPLAVLLDDAIVSAPIVMQRISGGQAHITAPTAEGVDGARTLAARLGAGPLAGRWSLVP